MHNRFCLILFVMVLIVAVPDLCFSDITVLKEVVIAPKGVHAAGNIGSVNTSVNVRLDRAKVDIHVDRPDTGGSAPLPLLVRASFELVNESSEELSLTVGFPISNSRYSSFQLSHFGVVTDGAVREVFRRESAYPRQLTHEYVSGRKGSGNAAPPGDITRETMKLFGKQHMGRESFQNLMVWEESFAALQRKKVVVDYEIQLPLQENRTFRRKEKGNHKGVWPQEANNVPVSFLQKIPPGAYYFFDYYLTSGASWAGPIAFEDITLHFDQWWRNCDFYSTINPDEIVWSNQTLNSDFPVTALYKLRDEEPTENIYFAIRPDKI